MPGKYEIRVEERLAKREYQKRLAAEKAAQYATNNAYLEERVRVLEQIVTDSGAQTAAQIEALREKPRLRADQLLDSSK